MITNRPVENWSDVRTVDLQEWVVRARDPNICIVYLGYYDAFTRTFQDSELPTNEFVGFQLHRKRLTN